MKFRYIIINASNGNITGTNDERFARFCEYLGDMLVDVLTGEEIQDKSRKAINAYPKE